MLRRRLLYLTVLACGLVFYFAYREWLSWVVLLWLIGLPLLSVLISLPAMLTMTARLSCPTEVWVGERAVPQLMVSCHMPMPPLHYRFQVCHSLSGDKFLYEPEEALLTEHCGAFQVNTWRLYVYDYMGLFRRRIRNVPGCRVLVKPRPVAVSALPEARQYLSNAWRPKPGGGFAENHDLRLYRPGDDLRHIHWKLAAKTNKLVYREPVEPREGKFLVTMVLSGSPDLLDEKLGKLSWVSSYLLENQVPHEIRCLTGQGLESYSVTDAPSGQKALQGLLCTRKAEENAVLPPMPDGQWRCHIGGGTDDA